MRSPVGIDPKIRYYRARGVHRRHCGPTRRKKSPKKTSFDRGGGKKPASRLRPERPTIRIFVRRTRILFLSRFFFLSPVRIRPHKICNRIPVATATTTRATVSLIGSRQGLSITVRLTVKYRRRCRYPIWPLEKPHYYTTSASPYKLSA